jgi:O-antigen ligase
LGGGHPAWGEPATAALLALATVYLGFNAGGFFPTAPAIVALALCVLTVLGVMLARRPFESFTPALLAPLGLLAGFAAWTLLSEAWSGAAGRAFVEFDLVLLYVLALAFFGMLAPRVSRLEWGLRGLAAGAFAICGIGWVTRVAADLWPISGDIHPERLSYPLTYWNALGLLAALGFLVCVHISSSRREQRPMRMAAAAGAPLFASVLLLTYSRSSLALAALGLLAYALLARPPRLVATLAAIGAPVVVALVATYRADLVSSPQFASSAAVSQGHKLALVVIACVVAAALLRGLTARRMDEWIPPVFEPRTLALGAAGAVAAVVLVAVALGGPSWVSRQYDAFVQGDSVGHSQDPRGRLTSAGNNGRIPQWKVALEAFDAEPLHGEGAGTYQLIWAQHRPYRFTVIDAHSLYVEVLGELGIVGFALLVGALLAIGVGLARRIRGEAGQAYAALLVLALVWAAHAGIDWDWEMPAVSLWLFALAGVGLSVPLPASAPGRMAVFEPGRTVRIVAAICVGVLALTPAAIAASQTRLDRAVGDFRRGDCAAAIDSALGSLEILKVRPEPYEVIGYCDIRLGQGTLAVRAMRNAVDRDPDNWETHYGLALAEAATGGDPMPELAAARRLNPLETAVREAIAEMRGATPRQREERAVSTRPPV